MGDFLSKDEGKFTANWLNDMFSGGNIKAVFDEVEELRKTFPHLPANKPRSKDPGNKRFGLPHFS